MGDDRSTWAKASGASTADLRPLLDTVPGQLEHKLRLEKRIGLEVLIE
jgi:hypothetical protein